MKINIICVGSPPTSWIKTGCNDYLKRFPSKYKINFTKIPATKRSKNTPIESVLEQEKKRIDQIIEKKSLLITLAIDGQLFNSEQLSQQLNHWRSFKKTISLVIGGPEGLSSSYKKIAYAQWSLSNLTFPHQLVKIIVLEQLYRATSILNNHPYHRI